MTVRALVLGLGLGLIISSVTWFNDRVAHQTQFIGHLLPASVYGVMVLLLLSNPVWRLIRRSWQLGASELAVMVAIALTACGFAGSNLMRYIPATTTVPAHLAQTNPAARSTFLLNYLPGATSELAPGQVYDWPKLVAAVEDARKTQPDGPVGRLYTQASRWEQVVWDQAIADVQPNTRQIGQLTAAINHVLRGGEGDQTTQADSEHIATNRAALVKALPDLIMPVSSGQGALVINTDNDEDVYGPIVTGLDTGKLLPVDAVPWHAWRGTLKLWIGTAALLGIAVIALTMIVHPQWSRREMLQYPIPRFVAEITRTDEDSALPTIIRQRIFWVGFILVVLLHVINGLHAWFPEVPRIQLRFDFGPLRQLFPNATQVSTSHTVFYPRIYLVAVAFAFMLNRSISGTLGFAQIIFLAAGSIFIANGYPVEYNKFTPNKMNLLRFGAYVGMAVMILYAGRTYYRNVILAAIGWKRGKETPAYAPWAMRIVAVAIVLAIALLTTSGMSPLMATILVGLCMLIWLVMARVASETGTILLAGPFLPLGVLPALIGMESIGPAHMLLLAIGGMLLVGDPKECLACFISQGLKIADDAEVKPSRIAPWMVGLLVVGLVVATIITVTLAYEHGIDQRDGYASRMVPERMINEGARVISDMTARGTLQSSVAMSDLDRLANLKPEWAGVGWAGIGMMLVIGTAVARMRWTWWPLHPVLFVVIGTWGAGMLWFSCMLGFIAKTACVGLGGTRAYHQVLPLAIGVIAAELTSGLGWTIIGWIYQLATGLPPATYTVFP